MHLDTWLYLGTIKIIFDGLIQSLVHPSAVHSTGLSFPSHQGDRCCSRRVEQKVVSVCAVQLLSCLICLRPRSLSVPSVCSHEPPLSPEFSHTSRVFLSLRIFTSWDPYSNLLAHSFSRITRHDHPNRWYCFMFVFNWRIQDTALLFRPGVIKISN